MLILRKYINELFDLSPWKLIINTIFMVMLGLLEGVGVLMLIPLLHFSGVLETGQTVTGNGFGMSSFFKGMDPSVSLPVILIIYIGIIFMHSSLQRYQSNLNVQIQQSFHSILSIRLFRSLAYAKWFFLAGKKRSDLTHLLFSELARITGGTQFFLQLTAASIISCIQIALAFVISPKLTLLVLIVGLVFLVLMQTLVRNIKEMGAAISRHNRDLFFAVSEHLNGIKEVKSCGMEEMHTANFIKIRRTIENNYVRFNRVQSSTQMMYKVGAAVIISIIFYIGVKIFLSKPEELLLIIVIFARLWPRLSSLQGGLQHIAMMLPAFSAVLDFERDCEKEGEIYDSEESKSLGSLICIVKIKKYIELKNISFRYQESSNYAVRNLSFTIQAGSTLVITGSSGSGKSTLADIIIGLITPQQGEVLIDGRSLNKIDFRMWRRSIGYVPQDAFLFNSSIRDNLLWANPEATTEEIWTALKMASADGFVSRLPAGLETEAGDRGVSLSGGERQRIVLARALLRKPALLILDEATNSLDIENERHIYQTINKLHGKLIIIIITHRLSEVIEMDQIIQLDQGRMAG